ncbi:hypothetical protein ASE12_11185 [Aeromicrobium sp. Root236]|uniref:YciI family protein n=1 Tax=Aeromicrobium sp. Root236 TaxID=1736498 RepID=UPI0007008939|nr:YciI family protein [Aeromicrobium sp. Root236]KRC65277.1 hypothetical protein ASE12_11185 [Aeromicrobium sp. Root236]
MAYFATIYRYTDEDARRDQVRPTHRDYLRQLTEQGRLAVSGPYVGGERGGALLIFIADDEAGALELSANDPFMLEGLVEERTVREWQPVSGQLADSF